MWASYSCPTEFSKMVSISRKYLYQKFENSSVSLPPKIKLGRCWWTEFSCHRYPTAIYSRCFGTFCAAGRIFPRVHPSCPVEYSQNIVFVAGCSTSSFVPNTVQRLQTLRQLTKFRQCHVTASPTIVVIVVIIVIVVVVVVIVVVDVDVGTGSRSWQEKIKFEKNVYYFIIFFFKYRYLL